MRPADYICMCCPRDWFLILSMRWNKKETDTDKCTEEQNQLVPFSWFVLNRPWSESEVKWTQVDSMKEQTTLTGFPKLRNLPKPFPKLWHGTIFFQRVWKLFLHNFDPETAATHRQALNQHCKSKNYKTHRVKQATFTHSESHLSLTSDIRFIMKTFPEQYDKRPFRNSLSNKWLVSLAGSYLLKKIHFVGMKIVVNM